jgi:hypothetical protein
VRPHSDPQHDPLDDEFVSLSIAARLVLQYVHSRDYIDPEESLTIALNSTARSIADVVPLYRGASFVDGAELDEWTIRRGDLRTALQRLGDA